MIDTSIYKLIFIFSTEYFTKKIIDLGDYDKSLLNSICMDYTKLIIDNGNNYYLHANFSTEKILDIENKFFKDIRASLRISEISILELSFKSLKLKHENVLERRKKFALCDYINSLTEEFYLYYLDNKDSKIEYFDNNNIENLISVKYLEVSVESWLSSTHESDKYIAKIMQETNEAVFFYYLDMIDIPFFKLYPYISVMKDIKKRIEFYDSISKSLPEDEFYNSKQFVRNLLFMDYNF